MTSTRSARKVIKLLSTISALGALGIFGVPTASADYEQVPEHFGVSGEAELLKEGEALAINPSGAGGVQPGSFYVVGTNRRVARFTPGKEGEEPQFQEAWGWGIAIGGPSEAYVRCGPAYQGVANPAEQTYEHCVPGNAQLAPSGEQPGQLGRLMAVAIDHANGNVYVRNLTSFNGTGPRLHHVISVFTAKGALIGEGFGDQGVGTSSPPESIAEGPGKLHRIEAGTALAVNDSGTVYVLDSDYIGVENPQTRVMSFEPCAPNDFAHYCYATGKDIPIQENPTRMSLIGNDRVVVASGGLIREYPVAGPDLSPACSLPVSGQLYAMTANEQTGEIFYFTFSDRRIHRLAPCNEATHVFEKIQEIEPQPRPNQIFALAVNPGLVWGPQRPPGVLYSVDARAGFPGVGEIFTSSPASIGPTVEAESISKATTTSVILHALIDPQGSEVAYHFEYLSEAGYLANGGSFEGPNLPTRAPADDGHLASGAASSVAAAAADLKPDTEYLFRVVATSECNSGQPLCVTFGEPASFATYPLFPPSLPDHRAYELVSPAQKHGGEVVPAAPKVGSCVTPSGGGECKPDTFGSGVFPMQSSPDGEAVSYVGQPFNVFEGAVNYDSYVSRRTASGWQTTALIPALPPGEVKQLAFNTTLESGLLSIRGSQLELQPTAEPGSTTPLLTKEPPNRTGNFALAYGGHSADFSRQFFAANDTLTEATPFAPEPPDPGASKKDLYEWHKGQLAVVNVAPGNATVLAGTSYASLSPDTHAVSEDGSRVFFKDEAGNLYVREGGEATRQINDPGHFLSATPDGSEVLLSDGCLYSLESESCTDLTEGQGGFKGTLGQSKDLSRIYFADGKALAAGAEAGTCTGAPGSSQQVKEEHEGKVPAGFGCNLYLYEAGAPLRFIATIRALEGEGLGVSTPNDWATIPAARTAEASPNGRFLAFASAVSLTGYDNVGLCGFGPEDSNGNAELVPRRCNEAFLYDSASGQLTCASCNPTGESPLGNTTLRRMEFAPEALPQPRYLTDEGRLYFDTQDSLSSRDTNEGVEDVYEFAPQGTGAEGTCEREAGCAFLISAGTEAADSNLIAVDETGKNVFFDTRDKLTLKDKDDLLDVYDAREGGGIAAETEISRAECQGENCQAPASPPNDATPGSSTFEGAGNVKEAPVAKKHAKKHKKHAKRHKAKTHQKARTAKHNHGGAK
jgi:hypothetical protein